MNLFPRYPKCPLLENLYALTKGALPDEKARLIEIHVVHCIYCSHIAQIYRNSIPGSKNEGFPVPKQEN